MNERKVSLQDLCKHLETQGFECQIEGNPATMINAVDTLEDAGSGNISFLANPKYRQHLETTAASAVIVGHDDTAPAHLALIRCADPYAAISAAIVWIHGYRQHPQWGRHEHATIDPTATIGANANIGPYVDIAAGVTLGANAVVYPGCYIGANATIGDDVILYPNVTIYAESRLGDRVTLHSGTVVGEDGLAYAPVAARWSKIPAIGHVVIEDDVEIGANCSINNATVGETRIGKGTKFSDGIVIGHGVSIGENCIFVAQSGVAGSTKIGNNVQMAGGVLVSGHLRIGDNVTLGGRSVVWSNIESGQNYLGNPAQNSFSYRKKLAAVNRLPDMRQKLLNLEREVAGLRKRLAELG